MVSVVKELAFGNNERLSDTCGLRSPVAAQRPLESANAINLFLCVFLHLFYCNEICKPVGCDFRVGCKAFFVCSSGRIEDVMKLTRFVGPPSFEPGGLALCGHECDDWSGEGVMLVLKSSLYMERRGGSGGDVCDEGGK